MSRLMQWLWPPTFSPFWRWFWTGWLFGVAVGELGIAYLLIRLILTGA
jgi:hypothetical protein